jgi:hypothetical protein
MSGYRPFSNGTEHHWWLDSNCSRGERGCRKYKPDAVDSRHGCPIEVAVALAGARDGTIPIRIAVRAAFLEPGPNGTLVEPRDDRDPHAKVIPACPEYKGYDEPDDRPRRGPRPPREQLDMLDPRNTPERSEVHR